MRISDCSSDVCSSYLLSSLRSRKSCKDAHSRPRVRQSRLPALEQARPATAPDRFVCRDTRKRTSHRRTDESGRPRLRTDRKSVGKGKRVSVRVVLGGSRIMKKKKKVI